MIVLFYILLSMGDDGSLRCRVAYTALDFAPDGANV